MTPGERAYVARLCAERAGLAVVVEKAYLLESRLAPVARREGFGSVGELLQVVRDRAEERLIGAAVTAGRMTLMGTYRSRYTLNAQRTTKPIRSARPPGTWPRRFPDRTAS